MKNFKIESEPNWYTLPGTTNRRTGIFIKQSVDAFYNDEYLSGNNERRETIGTVENIITTFKNQFSNKGEHVLLRAKNNLILKLHTDLPQILQRTGKSKLTVCVIPRSKTISTYQANQMLFKTGVIEAIRNLNGFSDGTNYILRHTNTRTTHMDRSGHGGDGELPYPGITKATCTISENVKGKDILLIDDLYTKSVNIDEDAIQALLDNGANSVVFYALGYTTKPKPDTTTTSPNDDLPF